MVHESTFGMALGTMTDAGEDEDFSLVAETVETSGSEQWVEKDLGPFRRGAVAGENDAPALIAAVNDIIKVAGCGWLKGLETKIIQH